MTTSLSKMYAALEEDHSPDSLSVWSDFLKEQNDPTLELLAQALLYCRDQKKWPYRKDWFVWCWARTEKRCVCNHPFTPPDQFSYDLPYELLGKMRAKGRMSVTAPCVWTNSLGEVSSWKKQSNANSYVSLRQALTLLASALNWKRKKDVEREEKLKPFASNGGSQ